MNIRKSRWVNFWQFILVAVFIIFVNGLHSLIFSPPTVAQACGSPSGGPTANPVTTKYGANAYLWTNSIRWGCVYNILDYGGISWDDRFNAARDAAYNNGGGVVYFPAGTYNFLDTIYLKKGVVIRGETPSVADAKLSTYAPPSRLEFPRYVPSLSGVGTPNNTAFKKILTTAPTTDSNIGIVNVDVNRAFIDLSSTGPFDSNTDQNIVIFGVRSNNVAEPDGGVPDLSYQKAWQRFSNRFTANIRVKALANVLVSNNRINDAITDNYEQPGYILKNAAGNANITHPDGKKALFSYTDHYGIVVNRSTQPADGTLPNNPNTYPRFFRKGITIQDNWVFHTMRVAIHATGDGLTIRNNIIRDQAGKQIWLDPTGKRVPNNSATFENRGIDWSGWNVTLEGNDYQVYRHQINGGTYFSVDGEGILIQECCGGTSINGVKIRNNKGNAYIGLYKVPQIQNVLITGNQLPNNVSNESLIYVNADTNKGPNSMNNVRIEQNTVFGSVFVKASSGGNGNTIINNKGNNRGAMSYSCGIQVQGNVGFVIGSCGI